MESFSTASAAARTRPPRSPSLPSTVAVDRLSKAQCATIASQPARTRRESSSNSPPRMRSFLIMPAICETRSSTRSKKSPPRPSASICSWIGMSTCSSGRYLLPATSTAVAWRRARWSRSSIVWPQKKSRRPLCLGWARRLRRALSSTKSNWIRPAFSISRCHERILSSYFCPC